MKASEPKQSLREEQKLLTRRRILEAAVRVFRTRGYVGATIDDIVSDAAISRATLYLHFKNKDEIATALFENMIPESADAYKLLDAAVRNRSRGDIKAWIEAGIKWWDENQGAVLVLEQIVATGGFGHGGLEQVQLQAVPHILSLWGTEQSEEASLRIYLLGTLVTRAYRAWRMDGLFRALPDDQVIEVLTDLWVAGLKLESLAPDGNWERSTTADKRPQ